MRILYQNWIHLSILIYFLEVHLHGILSFGGSLRWTLLRVSTILLNDDNQSRLLLFCHAYIENSTVFGLLWFTYSRRGVSCWGTSHSSLGLNYIAIKCVAEAHDKKWRQPNKRVAGIVLNRMRIDEKSVRQDEEAGSFARGNMKTFKSRNIEDRKTIFLTTVFGIHFWLPVETFGTVRRGLLLRLVYIV